MLSLAGGTASAHSLRRIPFSSPATYRILRQTLRGGRCKSHMRQSTLIKPNTTYKRVATTISTSGTGGSVMSYKWSRSTATPSVIAMAAVA